MQFKSIINDDNIEFEKKKWNISSRVIRAAKEKKKNNEKSHSVSTIPW
jgi:hypothetical protein